MESDFKKLSPEIQKHIENIQELLNDQITESSSEKQAVGFADNGGETTNRKACFKLVESENGSKTYVFDYLAW